MFQTKSYYIIQVKHVLVHNILRQGRGDES